jgi:UDP-glucose 4-epimerase
MKTVVVGGAGFVGLNIVEHLLEMGEDVVIFDVGDVPIAARAAFEALPGQLHTCLGDVRDPVNIVRALTGGADALVYGAAVTAGPDRDRSDPERTLEVNLNGYLNTLRAARDAGIRRVINLSSAGAYGAAAFATAASGEGLLEEDRTNADPVSIYSITKYASERIGDRMAEVWDMDITSVRLSAVFGRWERKTSVRDTPSPHFQILKAAIGDRLAILPRSDVRDWLYAPDVARAVHALRDASDLRHRLYNVSTGATWDLLDWGTGLAKLWPGFGCRLARTGEAATIDLHTTRTRKPLSIERLVADTGYQPRYGINESLADYHAWALDAEAA